MLALSTKQSVPPPAPPDGAAALSGAASEPRFSTQTATDASRIREAFDRHLNSVWRTLRRLGISPGEADDAAQRVFIVFARRIAEVEIGSERAFLLGTAARVASEIRRSPVQRRESRGDTRLEHEVDPQPLPDEKIELRRAGEILATILGSMPESLSEAFVLYEFEAMTIPEIAELLKVPVGTAASRLRRARDHFKERVAKLEAAHRRAGASK